MSDVEIRAPRDDERAALATVLGTSLNFPIEPAIERSHRFPLDDMRVALVGGEITSVAAEFRFDQWFAGRALTCNAVWGVATLPEHRGRGLASATTEAVMRAGRDRGAVVSALFPAVVAPYRRLGYELGGTFTKHRIPIGAIPNGAGDGPPVHLVDIERDTEDVRTCYRVFASRHTGPVEPTTEDYWTDRILRRHGDESRRAVVVREEGEVTGFLATGRELDPGPLDVAFGLRAEAFVANTEPALRSLLAYVRRYGGLGKWFQWSGPPNDPIGLLADDQTLSVDMHYRWMLRLLDVRAAFEQRGWPAIDAEVVFSVEDPLFPDNVGPWRLRVERGVATMGREAAGAAGPPITIGALSSMFSGYLRPADAVRLGLLAVDDQSLSALAPLFAGPAPWSPFFF